MYNILLRMICPSCRGRSEIQFHSDCLCKNQKRLVRGQFFLYDGRKADIVPQNFQNGLWGGESYQSDGATYMVEVTYRQGVCLNGRFGNFEYWNMDRILRESKNLSERLREGK